MTSAIVTMPEAFLKSNDSNQSFSSVLLAEINRLHDRGATKMMILLLLICEVLFVALTVASFSVYESTNTHVNIATSFITMLDLVLGIYVVCSVSKEHENNAVLSTLMVVPNRIRLFASRIFAWVILVISTSAIGYILTFLAMFLFQENLQGGIDAAQAFIHLVSSMFICGFTCVLCFSVGTIFRRVGAGLIVYLVLVMLGSLAISSVAGLMPEAFSNVLLEIDKLLPGNLSPDLTKGLKVLDGSAIKPFIAMIVWMVASVILSLEVFKKVTK